MKWIPFKVVGVVSLLLWLSLVVFVMLSAKPLLVDNVVSLTQIVLYAVSFLIIKRVYQECSVIARRVLLLFLIAIFIALVTDTVNYIVFFVLNEVNFFTHDSSQIALSKVGRFLHTADYIEIFFWYVLALVFLINLLRVFFIKQSRYQMQFGIFAICFVAALIGLLYLSQPDKLKGVDAFTFAAFISSILEIATFIAAIYGLIHSKSWSLYLLLSSIVVMTITQISALFYYSYQIREFLTLAYISGPLWAMLAFLAFYYMHEKQDYDLQKWFVTPNTMEARLAFSTLAVTSSSFIAFFVIAYAFNLINEERLLSFFFFLMISSLIAVLAAKRIALSFAKPFQQLQINMRDLMAEQNLPAQLKEFEMAEFDFLQNFICDRFIEHEVQNEKIKKIGKVAAQVAHDIRSPLSALNTCLKHLPEISENKRILMRNATNRINDITNNFLQQYTEGKDQASSELRVWLLAPVLESLISEKRMQFEGQPIVLEEKISSEGFAAFARFNHNEMKRVLSNLINNASESFSALGGVITVALDADDENIFLQIQDSGRGIPADKLEEVLKPGVSLKAGGSGLGLSHAKEVVEAWAGKLMLHSVEGEGTTVDIQFPRAVAPNWFISQLVVDAAIPIGILDDDASVHDAWDQHLLDACSDLKIIHHKTPGSFRKWYKAQSNPVQVFSDYELLGENESGLDVLESLNLRGATLVTSHYENPEIIKRCEAAGIRLLPKNLLAHIPIKVMEQNPKVDLVLIDDNTSLRRSWELSADFAEKSLLSCASITEFEPYKAKLDRTTPIYIDSDLGSGITGEEYAKDLFDLGFKEIYLVTGHEEREFGPMPWIREVRDKNPPF